MNKKCTSCGIEKDITEFYKNKLGKYGVGSKCKVCHLLICKAWYEKLPSERKEAYQENGRIRYKENPEPIRRTRRKWEKENKEKMSVVRNLWDKNHRDSRNAKDRRREAAKVSAPGNGITAKQEKQLRQDYCGICSYCGKKTNHLELDHIVPLISGGAHDIENATTACKSCNSKKSAIPLIMFLYRRYQLDTQAESR